MRKDRVYTDYRRWADDSLATLGGRTVEFVTGNAAFPDVQPDLPAYTALVTDYRQKLEIAKNGGSLVEITAKNKARTALLKAMKQWAFYVNMTAEGDTNLLASSGFILMGQPQAARVPFPPRYGVLEDGATSGEMNLRFEAIASAWEYEYQIAEGLDGDGQPAWGELVRTTNSLKNPLASLEPGRKYYARVRARNGKGESDWSTVFSQYAR